MIEGRGWKVKVCLGTELAQQRVEFVTLPSWIGKNHSEGMINHFISFSLDNSSEKLRKILKLVNNDTIYHFGSIYNNNSYHKVNEDINNLYIFVLIPPVRANVTFKSYELYSVS